MNDAPTLTPTEQADAEQVDTAVRAIQSGDTTTGQNLLLDVIKRCPSRYTYSYQDSKGVNFKFWDKNEFMHFVSHMKDSGSTDRVLSGKNLYWISSAYPRAFYYLGFLKVAAKQFDDAIGYLDRGLALEPTNPKLRFEKAMALTHLRRFDEALKLYESISQVGLHSSPADVARSFRGRGGVLLEMGQIDRAEAMFKESLKFDPTSKLAINELVYIAHLRSGGRSTSMGLTTGAPDSASKCSSCGKEISGDGHLVTKNGKSVYVCNTCQMTQTHSKKWWEVWK